MIVRTTDPLAGAAQAAPGQGVQSDDPNKLLQELSDELHLSNEANDSLTAKVQALEQQLAHARAAQAAGPAAKPKDYEGEAALPAPLKGVCKVYPPDPLFRLPQNREVRKCAAWMDAPDKPTIGAVGASGVGKTYLLMQMLAARSRPVTIITCNTDNIHDYVETTELEAVQGVPTTVREDGPLAKAMQIPGNTVLFDELDTAPQGFQHIILGMCEVNPADRGFTMHRGRTPVADGVQVLITCNALGDDPTCRHPGRLLPAFRTRAQWALVPMPSLADLINVCQARFPSLASSASLMAQIALDLMQLTVKGDVDGDISIRTLIKVFQSRSYGLGWFDAWIGAVGVSDPKALAAIQGTLAAKGVTP